MIKDIKQIENINDIYILKDHWDKPCGMKSNQKIIANRWMIPIKYCAEQCSMGVVELLEEYLFASNINANYLGSMNFIKAKAIEGNYDFDALVCNSLRYSNGNSVFADISKIKN